MARMEKGQEMTMQRSERLKIEGRLNGFLTRTNMWGALWLPIN